MHDDPPKPGDDGAPSAARDEGARVGRRVRQGLAWTFMGSVGTNLVRVVMLVVLGRLLTPGDFGLVAAALTVLLYAQVLRDAGVSGALVQRKELTRAHVESGWALSMGLGVVLAAILVAVAGPVASFYGMPGLAPIVQVLSLLFVLRGASAVSLALLQREMRFRALTAIDFCGYAVGQTTMVVCAVLDLGPWSLVIGYVVEAAIACALAVATHPPIRPRVHRRELGELLHYGGGQILNAFWAVTAQQGDYIVVGRGLGGAILGLYTRAYEFMRFPAVVFSSVAGSVLFPAFARLQDDPVQLGETLRRTLFVNAVILLPASVGLIILAPEVVAVVIGDQWGGVVLPLQIMSLTMLFRTNHKLVSLLAQATGDIYSVAVIQAAYAVMVVGGAAIGSVWGIEGVACSTALSLTAVFVLLMRLGLRRTCLTWTDVLAAHGQGLLAAVLVVPAWPVVAALRSAGAPPAAIVAAGVVVGSLGFVALFARGVRRPGSDWAWCGEVLAQVVAKLRRRRK